MRAIEPFASKVSPAIQLPGYNELYAPLELRFFCTVYVDITIIVSSRFARCKYFKHVSLSLCDSVFKLVASQPKVSWFSAIDELEFLYVCPLFFVFIYLSLC
jgi:hypothetical protein